MSGDKLTAIDEFTIQHSAFVEAEKQILQCLEFSCAGAQPEGVAVIGESGAGKTLVLRRVLSAHPPKRDNAGLQANILFVTLQPKPTIKELAEILLQAIGADDWFRGTKSQMTRRLQVLIREVGIRMIMIDEFQHFYDPERQKMMYSAADWLKNLIKGTDIALVVAGLPTCVSVIRQNEQLQRQFQNPITLPRFSWEDEQQRLEFRAILKQFHQKISEDYELPRLSDEHMAFRFYCATGGVIGYVAKILRKCLRNAIDGQTKEIGLAELDTAEQQVMFTVPGEKDRVRPFAKEFGLVADENTLDRARSIGKAVTPVVSRRKPLRMRNETLDAVLSRR